MSNNTLYIALGYQARKGKGIAAKAIYERFSQEHGGPYDMMRASFADALRDEVQAAAHDIWNIKTGSERQFDPDWAMKLLCEQVGVPFDYSAVVEPGYPYGKQRALYQHWGSEYRRAQDPFYWVKKLEQRVQARNPRVVIIDDLRFPNEFFFVKSKLGYTIKVERVGYANPQGVTAHHSETALDGFKFDFEISALDGHVEDLERAAIAAFERIVDMITPPEEFFDLGEPVARQGYTINEAVKDLAAHYALREQGDGAVV